MANITIYTRPDCGYCKRAIAYLKAKNQEPQLIDIDAQPEKLEELIEKMPKGRRPSVPQIFIENEYIGGCDDLLALSEQNLNQKLGV